MSVSPLKAAQLERNSRLDYGPEDELSAPLKLSRTTPRSSLAGRPNPAASKVTPFADLRQLAAIVRKPSTPQRRASSVGAPLSNRLVATNTPNTSRIRRPLAERSNPPTPYAIRALQQRQATPGRDRRKSGLLQRETPRDALRNLSKVLAPISQTTRASPPLLAQERSTWKQTANEELEDELGIPQPRFSIAMDEEADGDDDDSDEVPQRLSMPLEDGEQTGRSIEVWRYVASENQKGRVSRGSFGSMGPSDRVSNISESVLDDISRALLDNSLGRHPLDADADGLENVRLRLDVVDDTVDMQRPMFEPSNKLDSHPSGVAESRNLLQTDTHSPFVLNIPQFDFGNTSPRDVSQRSMSPEEQQHGHQQRELPDTQYSKSLIKSKANTDIKPRHRRLKTLKRSRHEIPYPSLPPGVNKKIATSFDRVLGGKQPRIRREALGAIMEAGDLFFQQLVGDLSAFADHARRKKIDESDVIAVMKRQRHLSATATPFSLAHKLLPAEMLRDLHLPVTKASRQPKKGRLAVIDEREQDADI